MMKQQGVVVVLCFVLMTFCITMYFLQSTHSSSLIMISICKHECGMGNQMFRYAAGLGLAERNPDFYVCWYSRDLSSAVSHPNSFFLDHVDTTTILLPECPYWTAFMGEIMLPRFKPPFSTYVPLVQGSSALVDGAMETFRYFPSASAPIYRLKAFQAAQQWMLERNLTSAIHVRRGDYSSMTAPLHFYKRNILHHHRAVVVTDDPAWVRLHPSVFGNCCCVLSEDHDPGFDMALLAAATDTVVIGIGTFAWWGAYLSKAKRVVYYGRQAGFQTSEYVEGDRMPKRWLKRF